MCNGVNPSQFCSSTFAFNLHKYSTTSFLPSFEAVKKSVLENAKKNDSLFVFT
jgi:hypothetical protein